MPGYADPTDGVVVAMAPLETWTRVILERLGSPADIAADVATVLLASDRRGIASHGTARLPQYAQLIEAGVVDPAARPTIESGRGALTRYDAHNGWGHHAGRVATDRAIAGVARHGVAMTVVRHSNHYGIAGWYALRAAAAGLIGISLTNSSPLVAPTRARQALLGTNPIAVASPAGRHGTLCLDMATSTVPRGRIEVAARRGESLPVGWAIDAEGRSATTAQAALGGALQPLGGDESTAGYKGYGLALVVDLLTGVLAGAASGPAIVPLFSTHDGPSDLGQAFIAIDPAALDEPGAFERRLEVLLDALVTAPTAPGAAGRVLVPGEPEAAAEQRADRSGIALDGPHAASLVDLGSRMGAPFPLPQAATPGVP